MPDLVKLKDAILTRAPLAESERDDDFADYVVTLLESHKTMDELASELQPVLGDDSTARFVDWLEAWLASETTVDDAPASKRQRGAGTDDGDDEAAKAKKEELKRLYKAYVNSGFKGDFEQYKVYIGTVRFAVARLRAAACLTPTTTRAQQAWEKKQDLKERLAAKTWHRIADGSADVRLAAPLMASRDSAAVRGAARGRGVRGRGRGVDAAVAAPIPARGRGQSKNLVWVRDAAKPPVAVAAAAAADKSLDESLPKTP